MIRTKIGLLIAFALTLIAITHGANAASPNIASLQHSEAGLVQEVHYINGKLEHTACAGSPAHNWRYRKGPDGVFRWYGPYSPCVIIWRPWKRPHID